MRCPKCRYIGFEEQDRCRNCGYDFSLSQPVDPIGIGKAWGAGRSVVHAGSFPQPQDAIKHRVRNYSAEAIRRLSGTGRTRKPIYLC